MIVAEVNHEMMTGREAIKNTQSWEDTNIRHRAIIQHLREEASRKSRERDSRLRREAEP
jgi:hypothetical protein